MTLSIFAVTFHSCTTQYDFVRNWNQSLYNVAPHLQPFIVCVGDHTYRLFQEAGIDCFPDTVATRMYSAQEPKYLAANSKYPYALALIRLGYSVMFSDTDIVWHKNPLDYIPLHAGAHLFTLCDAMPNVQELYKYYDRPYLERIRAPWVDVNTSPILYNHLAYGAELRPTYSASSGFWIAHPTIEVEYLMGLMMCVTYARSDIWEQHLLNHVLHNFILHGLLLDLLPMWQFVNLPVFELQFGVCDGLMVSPSATCEQRVMTHLGYIWNTDKAQTLTSRHLWALNPQDRLLTCDHVTPCQ